MYPQLLRQPLGFAERRLQRLYREIRYNFILFNLYLARHPIVIILKRATNISSSPVYFTSATYNYKKLYTVLFYLGVFNFCTCIQICLVCFVASFVLCVIVVGWPCVLLQLSCICVVILCVFVVLFFFTLDAGLLARSQYSEGPATGHLDTGFSWFLCVYKQMLRWFPTFQVATTCFSCSPADLNLLVTNFMFCIHVT